MSKVYMCRYDNGEEWSDHSEWNSNKVHTTYEGAEKEAREAGYVDKEAKTMYEKELYSKEGRLYSPDNDGWRDYGYVDIVEMDVVD